ncbi:hypothetical protein BDB00DRAFT_878595 [Zychaea mexicana]|uniref:uncharacterized protein n=1 Tax=Zychaea mexicana TaxID=64656 RepID=UPI0022FE7874|nr:uncharacterized protein BDB00DRAFT_878595 [Zychaea mexicana]KAI9484632.1 hypothetical protein BDB00DRAFT_878595 [Zychaea mexicana]
MNLNAIRPRDTSHTVSRCYNIPVLEKVTLDHEDHMEHETTSITTIPATSRSTRRAQEDHEHERSRPPTSDRHLGRSTRHSTPPPPPVDHIQAIYKKLEEQVQETSERFHAQHAQLFKLQAQNEEVLVESQVDEKAATATHSQQSATTSSVADSTNDDMDF